MVRRVETVMVSVVAAVAATVLTLLWVGDRRAPVTAASPPTAALLQDLQARVDAQAEQLAELAGQQARALRRLEALAAAPDAGAVPATEDAAAAARDDTDGTPQDRTALAATEETPEPAPAEKLSRAGVEPSLAQAIEQRIAALEMERLYLRDRATREGWRNTERFNEAQRELQTPAEAVRADYGDAVYERYLYAMGQGNRVVITSTLQDSPAYAAGIRAGDAVLSYAGQRVFSIRELQAATTAGEAGDSVAVELDRDGQRWYATVPRGPLGVRLDTQRARPAG